MKKLTIADYARARTGERTEKLQSKWKDAAKHPDDPETIHDLRVSIRRLIQCVRTFRQFQHRKRVKKVRQRLRLIMEAAGAVRNYDVALELMSSIGPVTAASTSRLKRGRRQRGKELRDLLKRAPKNLDFSRKTPRNGEWDDRLGIAANAKRVLPVLAQEFFDQGNRVIGNVPEVELHQFRLAAKRFRYTLELFAPVYGDELEESLALMRGLQDHLGAINDCFVTRGLLKGVPQAEAALGQLCEKRRADFRTYWRQKFGTRTRAWWVDWLARPRRENRKSDGDLHSASRRRRAA
jgi:CHAD domain-containing protein